MQPIQVVIEHSPFVSLAMQHNAVPIVHRLQIRGDDQDDLRLRLQMGDGFSLGYEETLSLRAGETWERVEPPLLLKAQELVSTLETTRSYLLLELFQHDTLVHQQHWPIEVLAYNHWSGLSGLPDLLCSFVLPHHPAVSQLVQQAGQHLGALDGYQSGQAYDQARAIYQAVQDWNIQYLQGSEGWLERGQKVRTPDQLLEHRQGNCLDLTCLMAAGLRRVGLHALIVLVAGHAFAGLWLRPDDDPDGALSDVSTLLKCLALGLVCFFDSSSACAGVPFEQAEAVARTYLTEEKFQLALDLRASERQGIRPLPLRMTAAGEVTLIHEEGKPDRDELSRAGPTQADFQAPVAPREAWEKRLHSWKNRLLDITTRNRLLDLKRDTNRRLLPILLERPQELLKELLSGATFTLVGRPRLLSQEDPRSPKLAELQAGEDVVKREVEDNFRQRRLQIDLEESETLRRSLELFRADRVNLEETGSSTLFLALGSLRWTETDKASVKRSAPLALLPVELVRVRMHEAYKMRWRGEDIRINLTLLRKLQADFKIDLSDLEGWPGDEDEIPSLAGLLQRLRGELINQAGWNLFEECAVGSFSFSKLLMLQDLERFPNLHSGSPMLRSFLTSQLAGPQPLVASHQVDERDPAQSHCVLDADSSQLAAVFSSEQGASFVLQGPPGTGKSQTITNIIAQNLAQGRTVLFVAEKLAALEVVYRRLQRQGLGPFCLQLHSNKASKGEILAQLRESLEYEAAPTRKGGAASLGQLQLELNEYVELLHRERPLGLTLYQAIARCSQLQAYPPLPCQVSADFGPMDAVLDVAAELSIRAREVGQVAAHPWRDSRLTQWEGGSRSRLSELLKRGQALLQRWQPLMKEGQSLWGLQGPPRASQLAPLQRLLTLLQSSPLPMDALLDRHPWREVRAVLDPALEKLCQRQQAWARLSQHFAESLLQLDLKALRQRYQKWMSVFLVGWLMLWGSQRQLKRVALGRLGKAGRVVEQLDIAIQVKELDAELAGLPLQDLLGSRWRGPQSDLEELRSLVAWSEEFRQQWSELQSWTDQAAWLTQIRAACNREERLSGASGRWLQDYLSLSQQLQQWLEELQFSLQLRPVERDWEEWQGWLKERLAQLDQLPDWTLFQEACQKLEGLHMEPVVQALCEDRLTPADLPGVCERSLLQGWLAEVVPHRFKGNLHQQRVEQFRVQDQQRLEQAQRELVTRLSERIPPMQEQGAKGEMALLLRELKKQRNLKAPRQLFKEVGNLLTRLKPCLLMSPLSIAQYLDPTNPPFDLVVFDEASQIAPWDALGALARGNQWVVVGDSRQLPPTSFFATQTEEDDEEVDLGGTLESILDECSAAGLPQLTLNWHYRSADERLIAFSNRHYYAGRLLTFPNAQLNNPAQGVHWHYVAEGVFARSASRTNRAEAECLVDHLVARLRQAQTDQTFGVVTFNQAQQNLIENLLDQARTEFPEIERHFVDCLEPVFIKNLENVQGDERDVIYFSIAYAADPGGKFRMEFGPLNRQGGERRLNVAVSRARQQMWVFSSIQPEQIDLNRAQARGARDLRAFLEYARRGGVLTASRAAQVDPLTQALRVALQDRGWQVEVNLGSSSYQIDLAVVENGRTLAGIEWDGPHYRDAHSARDRDRLRQAVLSGLGWRLIRVWAPDWWRDPERVLAEVEEALRQQPAPVEVKVEVEVEPVVEAEVVEVVAATRSYRAVELTPPAFEREPHQLSAAQFFQVIEPLLVAEAPLAPRYLFSRAARALGARQLGSRMRAHFESQLSILAQQGKLWIDEEGTVWPDQEQSRSFVGFRTGERDLSEIPSIELEATIAHEMALAISLSEAELVRSVARHYGKQKAGRELILARLQAMLERGRCRRHQDNWVWVG